MRRGKKEAPDAGSPVGMGLHTDSDSSNTAAGGGGGGGGHYTSGMFGLRAEGYGECDTSDTDSVLSFTE